MAWTCFRSSVPSTWPCVVTACSAAAWSTSISRPEIVSVQFVSLGKSRQSTTFRVMSPSVEQWQLWRTLYARGTARKAAPRVHVVARGVELDGSAGFPVSVQRALRLDQPHDGSDERQEDPQAGDSADRLLGSRCLVHVPDLGRHDERVHDADEDGEDQPDDAADAFAGVIVQLLERLVLPVQAIDAERDDRQEDDRKRRAWRPECSCGALRHDWLCCCCCHVLPFSVRGLTVHPGVLAVDRRHAALSPKSVLER